MSQRGVFVFLKQHKGTWFSCRELSEHLGVRYSSVLGSVLKLIKQGLLEFEFRMVRHARGCVRTRFVRLK